MRSLLKVGLTLVVLVAAIGTIGVALAWRHGLQELEARRAEFLERYRAAMEDSIRSHYFMFEKLPSKAEELVYPETAIRSPWVFDGMVECHFNRPSLEEGWTKTEALVFADVIARCPDKIPSWQRELDLARAPLRQREGDLAAQLELFSDPTFDALAGYQFVEQLRLEHEISEKTLEDFIAAAGKVAVHRKLLQQSIDPDRVEQFSGKEIAVAREEFEKVKSDILARAGAKHD